VKNYKRVPAQIVDEFASEKEVLKTVIFLFYV
jgi:hypothetical protein